MMIFFLVLSALMALVIYFDLTRYLIPNWLVGMVVVFYPAMVLMAPAGAVDWINALLTFAAVFAIGCAIFALRWMGGGDIKMMAAVSLWCGWPRMVDFLLAMAIFGGLLSIVLIVGRRVLIVLEGHGMLKMKLPRILRKGEPVPYGLAIAASMLWLLWKQMLPGLTLN